MKARWCQVDNFIFYNDEMLPIIRKNSGIKCNLFTAYLGLILFFFVFPTLGLAIELSEEERAYLRAKETIVFVSQTQYPPFEFVDANGQHEGMMLDIIRWIAVETGFKPAFLDMTFQQAQEAVLSGKADVISSLFYSDKRKEKFEFTTPLFAVPASIFTKVERTDIKDIKDLNGKMIAMQWGDYAKEFLESQKTYFFTLITKDFSEAATRVVAGQADAVVGDEQVIYYHIFSNRLTGSMKKVGEPLYIGKNCMATNRNNAILIGILNKGINEAVNSGQLDKITTKWMGTTISSPEKSFLVRYTWQITMGAGVILMFLLLIWVWNVRLRILVQKKTADITLREEALRESEARYRSILNASPDDITITDMEGRISMVSPVAVIMFGYTPEETGIGRMVTDFIAPDDRDRALSNIALKLQGTITGPSEYRGLRMDGSVFDIEVNSDFIRGADGQPNGMVLVVRDITARKIAEEALRASRKQLTDIIEFLPDATLAIDKEKRVIIWNKAIETMTGIPAARMIGKGDHVYTIPFYGVARPQLMDLIFEDHEEIAARYPHIIHEADTLMTEAFCNALYSNKGAWIFAKATPLRDEAGNIIGAIESIRDITKLKNAQVELQQRERYFRTLFENAGDAIFIEDENDRILDINNRACDLLGYTREELLQMYVPDLQAPELRGQKGSVIRDELDRRGGLPFETINIRKDGQYVAVEVMTVLLSADNDNRVLSIVRDITERKKAAADQERLRQAIEQSGETIVITDSQGIIQYANPTFSHVTGYSLQEAVGKKTNILKSGKHDESFYRGIWATISSGKTWQGQMTNKKKNGLLYTEEATISPVMGSDGKVVNYIAVKLDITEKLKIEQERLLLQSQFIQAQKMEAVGRLAGGVAHDFNNMLGVIIGYSELILQQMDLSQQFHAEMEEIQKAARRSADLTRQLLTFARKQTVAPQVLHLNNIIDGMLNMLRRLIGENINLIWVPGSGLWPIKMDPSQIDQILANLCVNARDAIAGVGKLTVETENASFDQEYCESHAGALPGEYVRISVSDTGIGMDKQTLTHIFEPFFTTKGVGEGTGIGLATVYGAVKQNNGYINAYSEPGRGTTFTIYIPRHIEKITETRTTKSAEPVLRGNEIIILVEDESTLLALSKTMLERLGYTVLAADTPSKAIHLAGEYYGQIHLLATDVIMPEMNGLQLSTRLMENRPEMKCLFMSGYTANIIANQGVLKEGVSFIQKPFLLKELAAKVREALES